MKIKNKINLTIILPLVLVFMSLFTGILFYVQKEVYSKLDKTLVDSGERLNDYITELQYTMAKSYIISTGDIVNRNIERISRAIESKTIINDNLKKTLNDYLNIEGLSFDGYIYIVDKEGKIVIHPDHNVIGENSIISKWILSDSKKHHFYRFKNRDKVAYKIYNSDIHAYVITSAYIDSFARSLDIERLSPTIAKIRYGADGYPMLFNVDGTIVVHPDRKLIGTNIKKKTDIYGNLIHKDFNLQDREKITFKDYEDSKIIEKVIYYTYNSNSQLFIGSVIIIDDYFGTIKLITKNSILIVLPIIIISIILSTIYTNNLVKELEKLNSTSKKIAQGSMDEKIDTCSILEINELSHSVDIMRNNLLHIIQELQDHKNSLEEVVTKRTLELEKSHEQLIHAEKMSSLGGLVAGVAHEINTPIGIGVTAASHLEEEVYRFSLLFKENKITKSAFADFVDKSILQSRMILSSLGKASHLITSFKKLAVDQSQEEIQNFNLKMYLDEVMISLHHIISTKKVNFRIKCDSDIRINSYPGAFSQILTILIQNSVIHGFTDNKKNIIHINIIDMKDYIQMNYIDNGDGIPIDNIDKIFEPFFTTNRNGGGTGLGLHLLYNIVLTNLLGSVTCTSKIGAYTKFKIKISTLEEL